MKLQGKKELAKTIQDSFNNAQASFLVNYRGLSVVQLTELRNKLREQEGIFKVAKLTIIRHAIDQVQDVGVLSEYLKDQLALVFAQNESPAIAKVLRDFAEENEQLEIIAGVMDSQLLSIESIISLAKLPSKGVLIAQLLGTLQAPARNITCVLNMLILRLLFVLKEIEKKKVEQ